ncbi:diaminopimelate decarboxylase [Actinomycetospora flava]|uniref:Diaminopimelate decarboxylase n=1 Tax=Actinomycetospora flava TaxID=3129232 RepID=A0ABU8M3J2_9PSEU
MTLETLIPSLRSSLYQRLDPATWPLTARSADHGDVAVGGVALRELAARFGTPAYVLDTEDVRARCRAYRRALPDVDVSYAGKAFLCRAMAGLVAEEGLGVDVCSAGELAVALRAGVAPHRLVLHGNAKTGQELATAVAAGVGRVVVDSADEVDRLAAVSSPAGYVQHVLLRIAPGVEAGGHPSVATGGDDQKFGVPLADAPGVAGRILSRPGLRLVGLHTHLGSRIRDTGPWERALPALLDLVAEIAARHDVTLDELSLGGGHGVGPGEEFDLDGFARRIPSAVRRGCALRGLPALRLAVEPGRALVARAGVTLYRVVGTKHAGSGRWFVAVDGGMSDNPRPALYGARYDVHLVGRSTAAPWAPATVVGRHCESGDVLARDVTLPADVAAGDVLAVPGTGAYHHSMASTYNLVPRPPVVAVADGTAREIVRRETVTDLMARDLG